MEYHHSVSLDASKCIGCTNCIKRCPTEAIRVKSGKAHILTDRCIDCGECIRICPHNAKKAVSDHFSDLPRDKFNIALPAPSLYGQFAHLEEIDYVLAGLLKLGFDEIYEVARAAEIVSDYTRRYLKRPDIRYPVISSACPVITRLIMLRYPYLCDHILPIEPPLEVAAMRARMHAKRHHPELTDEDIRISFITPCPAKVSYIKCNREAGKSHIDYAFSVREMYIALLGVMKKNGNPPPLSRSGRIGIGWATVGGEATAIMNAGYLSADGIENVIRVLEEIDNGTLNDLEFIELNACDGGCVGGVMNVANPFVAKARMHTLRHCLPVSQNWADASDDSLYIPPEYVSDEYGYTPVSALDNDPKTALEMMTEIENLRRKLPGFDCGFCGAPSCAAFASDVVKGKATLSDCIVAEKPRNGDEI